MARRPRSRTARAVSSSSATARAATATSAPAPASARAMARPRPRLAPVTTATLPSRPNAERTELTIEGIELLLVLLGDDLALHLERRREEAVVDREVVREDEELLDLGVGLQLGVPVLHDPGHPLDHL